MPSLVVEPAKDLPPRRAFTVAEVLRMQQAGILGEDENFELIEGEIVPMQAKTHVHELIKSALNLKLARALPDDLWLGVESTMYLSDRTFVEPDLVVYRRGLKLEEVKGPDILLAIEVALTSLAFDRGLKASLYAHYGVRELWVVDAAARITFMHKGPSEKGWGEIIEKGPD
ncbi:MAG: Uma2 family endonuclease [Methylovirgula sp.]